jgi:hypothetical protein
MHFHSLAQFVLGQFSGRDERMVIRVIIFRWADFIRIRAAQAPYWLITFVMLSKLVVVTLILLDQRLERDI